jgi:type I restriction enzyme S subunit
LLYSKIRPYLNKCIRAEFDGLCSADMYPVDAFISAGFLHYFMLTRQFVGAVSKAAGSRTILPKTNQAQMSNLPVPVAPLPEQLRIVDAVDSYVTRLDAAERSLREARRRLKAYRASVLKAAVEGRLVPTEAELARKEGRSYEQATVLLERILQERRRRWEEAELARMKAAGKVPQDDKWKARYSEPEPVNTLELPVLPTGWAWARVSSVGTVQLGRQRAPQHHRGPHMRPYLRVANVFEDQIDTSDVMSMNFSPEEFEVYRLEHGDILLNEGQSPHLVGRPAMYRGEVAGACFQNTLVRFKASSGISTLAATCGSRKSPPTSLILEQGALPRSNSPCLRC